MSILTERGPHASEAVHSLPDPLPSPAPYNPSTEKAPDRRDFSLLLLRGQDLHLRPQGYEPCELLLLHPASCNMLQAAVRRNFHSRVFHTMLYTTAMKKLPAKMHGVILPFIVTMIMSAIVAAISTVHALGFSHVVFRV